MIARYSNIIVYTCAGIMLASLFIWLGVMVHAVWEAHELEKKTEQLDFKVSGPYKEDVN